MSLTLYIDTSESAATRIVLKDGDAVIATRTAEMKRAQTALPLIERILKEEGKELSQINAIEAHTGPGSFTGLRVGLAIAQMLSVLLNIPLNGQPPGSAVSPRYDDGGKFDTMDK